MRLFRQGWLKTFPILLALSPALSLAVESAEPGRLQERKWKSTPGKCALSRFSLANYEHDERNAFGQTNAMRGSMMAAAVETSDPSCLKEYGIVQYVRGCLYNVRYSRADNRITKKYFGVVREQRGKTVPFVYSDWDVDTVDADPLYNSTEGSTDAPTRLDRYRYPKRGLALAADSGSLRSDSSVYFDPKNHGFLGDGKTGANRYFVTDIPTFADWNPDAGAGEEEWVNASLEFETCVYRVKDVPVAGNPRPPGTPESAGGPVACFSWDHKQVFDPASRSFKRGIGVDAACSSLDSSRVVRSVRNSRPIADARR
jgi:hypothetical protein